MGEDTKWGSFASRSKCGIYNDNNQLTKTVWICLISAGYLLAWCGVTGSGPVGFVVLFCFVLELCCLVLCLIRHHVHYGVGINTAFSFALICPCKYPSLFSLGGRENMSCPFLVWVWGRGESWVECWVRFSVGVVGRPSTVCSRSLSGLGFGDLRSPH